MMAKLLGYNAGGAAGLLSGACTISAVRGVATEAINSHPIAPDQKKAMLVAYVVTTKTNDINKLQEYFTQH